MNIPIFRFSLRKCFRQLHLILEFALLFSCNHSEELGDPSVTAGTAKITGRMIRRGNERGDGAMIYLSVTHPVTGENIMKRIQLDDAGTFSCEVDMETTPALCGVYSDINPYKTLLFPVMDNENTRIEVTYDSIGNIEKVDLDAGIRLSTRDIADGLDIVDNMMDSHSGRPGKHLYDESLDSFLIHAETVLKERLNILDNAQGLSKSIKNIFAKDFTLLLYSTHVFNYENAMKLNYHNYEGEKPDSLKIQPLTKPYFSFLKKWDLNNPQYLYCFTFPALMEVIFQNEILNIPPINETSIEEWLKEVKFIMADLVGFDSGLFYDALVCNAYARQFNDRLQPLSGKQVENIKNYFGDKPFTEILLRKNGEIKPFAGTSSSLKINETPVVPENRLSEGQLLDAIVSRYRGKVVVVDLWATWCQPCMKAMQEMRPLKKELTDRGAVFVYLTDTSSPQSLWKEKIPGIGGEHYYLNGDEWKSISYSEKYGFQYIPTYFIFDAEGNLKSKLTGYPGNDEFRKLIDELLSHEIRHAGHLSAP